MRPAFKRVLVLNFYVLIVLILFIAVRPVVYEIPLCLRDADNLAGRLFVNKTVPDSFTEIEKRITFVKKGGWWKPTGCRTAKKVGIIIPYRNRQNNLMVLLRHIHPILKRQQLDYRIFVVEQYDKYPFNKAKLNNVGVKVSAKYGNFNCFVFHDADFLLANDLNYHDCPVSPIHMSPSVEKFKYIMEYREYMGGVISVTSEDLKDVNGWSNRFWGWGAEDDDMFFRFSIFNKLLTRPSIEIGRYDLSDHIVNEKNKKRVQVLDETAKRTIDITTDGLNNIRYKLIKIVEENLFTYIKVDTQMQSHEVNTTSIKSLDKLPESITNLRKKSPAKKKP